MANRREIQTRVGLTFNDASVRSSVYLSIIAVRHSAEVVFQWVRMRVGETEYVFQCIRYRRHVSDLVVGLDRCVVSAGRGKATRKKAALSPSVLKSASLIVVKCRRHICRRCYQKLQSRLSRAVRNQILYSRANECYIMLRTIQCYSSRSDF